MKTSRIVSLIFIFIVYALLEVFLQTEIVKLGYENKKNEDRLSQLIDANRILKYNIYVLESPYSLDKLVLAKKNNMKTLKAQEVLNLYSENKNKPKQVYSKKRAVVDNQMILALRQFFAGRQAEAKVLKENP